MPIELPVIVGCTAAGKSDLAEAIAARCDARLLAVDSMQVYRGMDIGTAKPTAEVRRELRYHGLDLADPSEAFSAAEFVAHARPLLADIDVEDGRVLLVAGTILYLKALTEGLFEGPPADEKIRTRLRAEAEAKGSAVLHARLATLDPKAAEKIHPNDLRRIERALEVIELTGRPISAMQTQFGKVRQEYKLTIIGVRRDRDDLAERISRRVDAMMSAGLLDEVRRLAADPRGLGEQASAAVGYAELLAHLRGELSLEEAMERIRINTRHLAKHQRTWLRRFEPIHWLDAGADQSSADLLDAAMALLPWQST